MTETKPAPVTLRWRGDRRLDKDMWDLLCGPGGAFERRVEDVLGAPVEVFVQRPRSIPAMLAAAVEREPDTAYLVLDGPEPETLTFADTARLARAYAEVLAAEYGIGRGDRVAVAAANGREHLLLLWGTLTLGAVAVGLNGWWAPAELDHGLRLTGPKAVFGLGRPLERLRASEAVTSGEFAAASLADLHAAALALGEPARALTATEIAEDDPALIMFTSGTTNRPKGVTLSHRNVVHFGMFGGIGGAVAALTGTKLRQVPPDLQRTSILANPLFHVSGACVALANATLYGLRLIILERGKWDAERALEVTDRYRLTQWTGVPTHFWRMLTHPDFDAYRTDQVTVIGSGGATFAPELLRLFARKMPGLQITNGYGMTETTGSGTFLNGPEMDGHPASVGAAAPTVEVQVRDESGAVLPEGQIGEIHVRSASVFLGYWNDPAATSAALTPDRWYRSGDYGRISDNVLYLESRMRDLIIRGGENIYPIEIEYRLLEHPAITDAAVIGAPHPSLGQEVKAFIVKSPHTPLTPTEIRTWVSATLAAFKVPTHITFLDSLPYNETGKILKRHLEAQNP
ncbi:class I adenylate-forming enzyme family protein [Actinocorallia sp. A-T 12471]|uniref:class I adenylate-forming enzyme family protein n=1 Tax=Actinocorallia sp. A-T 12471 TaxID=3089813 RepID=UPI0029CCC781|nr:class I adenylate-forming enzyme family protein [Actinocorallia sp. A-T 12471]MDX6740969.1 class I adenylate-forming enzyme family protein [Actinocorallia sp. A-T 12471]